MTRLAYLLILIICARFACAREYEYTILDVTVLNEYLTGNEVHCEMAFLRAFADGERGKTLLEEAEICIEQLGVIRARRTLREEGFDLNMLDLESGKVHLTKDPARIFEQLSRFAIGRKPFYEIVDMKQGVLAVTQKKAKCQTGVIDVSGQVILPFEYDIDMLDKKRGRMTVVNTAGKYALFDYAGMQLTDFCYDYIVIERDCNCYTVMDAKGNEGLIDLQGNVVLPLQYRRARCYYVGSQKRYQPMDHCFWIDDKSKRIGVADTDGNIVIPCKYQGAYYDSDKTDPTLFPRKDLVYFVGIFTKNGKEYIDIYDPLTWECIRSMERPRIDDD